MSTISEALKKAQEKRTLPKNTDALSYLQDPFFRTKHREQRFISRRTRSGKRLLVIAIAAVTLSFSFFAFIFLSPLFGRRIPVRIRKDIQPPASSVSGASETAEKAAIHPEESAPSAKTSIIPLQQSKNGSGIKTFVLNLPNKSSIVISPENIKLDPDMNTVYTHKTNAAASGIPREELPELNGIMYSPSSPSAVLGGTMVKKGDTVDGFTVEKIHSDKVILKKGSEEYTLSLK